MITIKDVKDKIIEYLYNADVEKLTAAETNGLANIAMILKSVSEIRENTEDVFSKTLASLYGKMAPGFNAPEMHEVEKESE